MRKYFICRRLRMADFLKKRGLYPVEVVPDANNPKYNVWRYVWDDNFEKARQEYIASVGKAGVNNG